MARSTMSTDRKRCSLIAPFFRFLILACTRPRRLPGVLCWASTTRYNPLSCLMHIPRFSPVAWIIDSLSPKPPSYSSSGTSVEPRSVDLEPAQVEAEVDDLEAGRADGRRHLLLRPGDRPHRDHPSPARAAHPGRSAFRGRRLRDLLDLGAAHAGSEALPRRHLAG